MQQHEWKRDNHGAVDVFVQDVEFDGSGHNGPGCAVCDFNFCMNCWPEGWDEGCPGPAPEGMAYDWYGTGTTREPEQVSLITRSTLQH